MWRWLTTIWLGFVVGRYGTAVWKSLREPNGSDWDVIWLIVWLFLLAAVAVTAVFCKTSSVNRFWLVLFASTAIVILVLSDTLTSSLIASTLITVAAGVGAFIIDRFGREETGFIERFVVAVPVGLGILALVQLVLAGIGQFNPRASWTLLIVLAIPAVSGLRSLFSKRLEDAITGHPLVVVPMGYVFLLELMWATAPEIQYDALNVHLAVPKLYLQYGGLVDLPYFFHSYFAHLTDMIFALCLALGGAPIAKFFVLFLGVLAALGTFVVGKKILNEEAGVWAAVIFYSTPLAIWSSTTAYVDLSETAFIVTSVVAFMRWYETSNWKWLAASGWIAGIAVGTKAMAIVTVLVFPVAAAWRLWSTDRIGAIRALAAYALLLLIVATPWYLVVYAHTGNPFFPFLNGVFRSPQWRLENTRLDAGDFGIGTSAGSLLRLPFRLTFETGKFGNPARGTVGFALLLAFPFAFAAFWKGGYLKRCLLAAITIHVAVWAATFQYGRYYFPVIPLVAAVGCASFLFDQSQAARVNRILLLCGILVQVPLASLLFWNIPERFPVRRVFASETEHEFLARTVEGYDAAQFLSGIAKPGERVLSQGFEPLRFYLNAPIYTEAELELDRVFGWDGLNATDFAAALARGKFTYILASPTEIRNPSPWNRFLKPEFLNRFTTQIYQSPNAVVLPVTAGDLSHVAK